MKIIYIIIFLCLFMASCGGDKGLTISRLKEMADAETTAQKRYLSFSKQALSESSPEAAALFKALAESERIHAKNYITILTNMGVDNYKPLIGEIKRYPNISDAIRSAINGESGEANSAYPSAIKDAEGFPQVIIAFHFALDCEISHSKMLTKTLSTLGKGDNTATQYYVCPQCGYIYTSSTFNESCVLCNVPSDRFIAIK